MPRVAIKKKDYKLKDLKGEIVKLMKMNGITQAELGKALNLSQSRVCEMLKMEGEMLIRIRSHMEICLQYANFLRFPEK